MSLSLGEKLRQAREERGLSLAEVAEQTRISSLYLESIENDDYKILPGGIFNKGFVKSYAKFVGINEQEALADYTSLISGTSHEDSGELKVFRPEVLTDDRASSSNLPTIILAAVILAAMTGGILFLLNYLRQPAAETPVANANTTSNNSNSAVPDATPEAASSGVPEFTGLKVEFKTTEPVSLTATKDGSVSTKVITPGSSETFEPRESLKLSYSKSLAKFVELSINGKAITPPSEPIVPRRNVIEFEINKANLEQIWTAGAIPAEPNVLPNSNAGAVTPRAAPPTRPAAAANTNTPAAAKTPAPRPSSPSRTPARGERNSGE